VSSIVAVESSDADRLGLLGEIADDGFGAFERSGFYSLPPTWILLPLPRACHRGEPRDLFLAQRIARHVSPLTTTVYTHPSEEEVWEKVRGLVC
jgi:hypothetical protein